MKNTPVRFRRSDRLGSALSHTAFKTTSLMRCHWSAPSVLSSDGGEASVDLTSVWITGMARQIGL